jgi:hypothetical protein
MSFLYTSRESKIYLALVLLGIAIALERRTEMQLLPFDVPLIDGKIPSECLLWTGIIMHMAAREVICAFTVGFAQPEKDSRDF